MAQNDFLPFAVDTGANVLPQDEYMVTPEVVEGFTVGLLESAKANKVWRQSSFVSAAIAKFIYQSLSQDVLDNGNIDQFVSQFITALVTVSSGGNSSVYVSDQAPNNPFSGQLWIDATTCQMYFWFEDGTSNQWVIVNSVPAVSAVRTSTKTANYTVLPAESGIRFNNIGATTTVLLTLPVASPGMTFGGVVFASQYLTFKASGSDVVSLGANTSGAAGYVRSNTPYSSIQLDAHSTGRWVVTSAVGTWSIDT